MLRGWDAKNPFEEEDVDSSAQGGPQEIDDGGDSIEQSRTADTADAPPEAAAYEPPPPPPPPQSEQDPIMMFRSPEPPAAPAKPLSLFREWDAANKRYEEEKAAASEAEVLDEDPLALSPGSNSVGGSFGGWSVAPGMMDGTVSNPFDVEEDSDDDDGDSKASERSSSPRTGCCKRLGLSMVKEDDEEEANRGTSGTTMFDDVDLEANPDQLPTASNMVGSPVSSGRKRDSSQDGLSERLERFNKKRSSITNRVMQELQSNPNLKFRAFIGLTAAIVFSCLIAVIVATSSSKNRQPIQQGAQGTEANDLSSILDLIEATSSATTYAPTTPPTPKPSSESPTKSPSMYPTWGPTYYPTQAPTSTSPTGSPSAGPTTKTPSFSPTAMPTYSPSRSPVTPAPTRDCNDDFGEFETHNGNFKDCVWLDNGYNGAKSTRKDLNCLTAAIGEACPYTCRLYNGCMEYLLAALPEYTNENDVSVGGACQDKPGSFMSNGGVVRECSWIGEDPETAPAKKNLNCGTPHVERTELGIMCPASCAGYNNCARMADGSLELVSPHNMGRPGGGSGGIQMAPPHPLAGLNDVQTIADSGGNDGPMPTPFPTDWSSGEPTALCYDHVGEYLTHTGTLRQCRWLNRDGDEDDVEEKKRLNCGITEIGRKCLESCPCDMVQRVDNTTLDDAGSSISLGGVASGVPTAAPATIAPTPFDELTKGVFDDANETLTLVAYADSVVSEKDPDENVGDSKRLNVEYLGGSTRQRQSLILFDLSFVAKSFDTVTEATLRLYSVTGSDTGGVTLKKMSDPIFNENDVTWNTVPGGDGANELTISFVDTLEANTWYDVDVTAAVIDAIENGEPRLGIRIVSEDDVDLYFGSRERVNEPPTLVVDSRTAEPTQQPIVMPTYSPTASPSYVPTYVPTAHPTVALDCMNKQGYFVAHTGEDQPCSWLDVGNGAVKKEMNCAIDRTNVDAESAAMFCQASCSEYNGCDDLHCEDMTGSYATHTGWTAECSWLLTGNGALKLEQNCGANGNDPTEIGKRCQKTCADYNGCIRR